MRNRNILYLLKHCSIRDDVHYMENCIFMDESGFSKKEVRREGYSKRGVPCVIEITTQRAVNLSIIGCISSHGLLLLSRHAPLHEVEQHVIIPGTKKRQKVEGRSHGTKRFHFYDFVKELIDILKEQKMEKQYFVLDNASIHKGDGIEDMIRDAGHAARFLSAYSPFLNPIEQCWRQIKQDVERRPLTTNDDLFARIEKVAPLVTAAHCQGFIRNAMTFFAPSLAEEDILYDEQFRKVNNDQNK